MGGFVPYCLFRALPKKMEELFSVVLEKILFSLKIISLKNDFGRFDIELRSTCFIQEAKEKGMSFKAIYGPFGYTNHFQAKFKNKVFRFNTLPAADFLGKYGSELIDDKAWVKEHLKKRGFPVSEGKAFWFWRKRKSLDYGVKNLGFPLVVKPRDGSLSRHVTTDIKDINKFKQAIKKALIYSPSFIVEKFLAGTSVFRATVVNFDFVACVQQIPANVVGDGVHNIRQLIDIKNNDFQRGQPDQKGFTLYKITENETTENLLKEKGYNFFSFPKKGEIVYLQKDPFLKLGGDLVEATEIVHPVNLRLFRNIARFFDIRLVGIDFLAEDISIHWQKQICAVLELNSVPCIELHRFPSSGKPQNVAEALVDLFFKTHI